ncbi:MAG TPA: hypothetical protein VFQ24_07450 [Terriglobia bacterium]|nr:hypothetical protein [Terriglobia bacterium]
MNGKSGVFVELPTPNQLRRPWIMNNKGHRKRVLINKLHQTV